MCVNKILCPQGKVENICFALVGRRNVFLSFPVAYCCNSPGELCQRKYFLKRDFDHERKSDSLFMDSIKACRNRAIPNPTQVCIQMT